MDIVVAVIIHWTVFSFYAISMDLHHFIRHDPAKYQAKPLPKASVPVVEHGARRIVARQRSKRLHSSAASVAFMLFFVHHFVGVADVEHQIEPLRIKAVKHPLGKR